MLLLLSGIILANAALADATFTEPFDTSRPDLWALSAGGTGKAVIAGGRPDETDRVDLGSMTADLIVVVRPR